MAGPEPGSEVEAASWRMTSRIAGSTGDMLAASCREDTTARTRICPGTRSFRNQAKALSMCSERIGMPFRKTAKGKYKSPSGRVYTRRQVRAYYATSGFKRAPRRRRSK